MNDQLLMDNYLCRRYKSGTISFLLFALATEDLEKGNTIILSIKWSIPPTINDI